MLLFLSYLGMLISTFDGCCTNLLPALDIPVNIAAALSPIDQLGMSSECVVALDTARYTVLSGLTVTVTGLVVARLLLIRRRCVKLMGESADGIVYTIISLMIVQEYQTVLTSALLQC